jgi:hypothetical protein
MYGALVYDAARDDELIYPVEAESEEEARRVAIEYLSGVEAGWVELWGDAGLLWAAEAG